MDYIFLAPFSSLIFAIHPVISVCIYKIYGLLLKGSQIKLALFTSEYSE